MKRTTLDLLVCSTCHGQLECTRADSRASLCLTGELSCMVCLKSYSIVGGINFFDDKQAAVDEMIRVAAPGSRILIADETERSAQGYEKLLPGFKHSFEGSRATVVPPIDLVPAQMLETRLFDVWKGWFYCLEFRKP